MKILLLTDRLPFPPRDGIELPIEKLFKYLANIHDVSILVVNTNIEDYQNRISGVPKTIQNTHFIQGEKVTFLDRCVHEFMGNRPAFINLKFDSKEVNTYLSDKYFDVVWVSPVGAMSFIMSIRKLQINCFRHLALGMNDVLTVVHKQALCKFISRGTFELSLVIKYLRSPFIKKHEQVLYKSASYVHLQTIAERDHARKMLGTSLIALLDKVHAVPNGLDSTYINQKYEGFNSDVLLFITSLSGSRAKESQWFIKKVWPIVRRQTDLKLHLVGAKPNKPVSINDDRIVLKGFVDSLPVECSQAAIGILPIFHNSGLINRLHNMLSIGLPVVSMSAPALTMPMLKNGEHLLIANSGKEFADLIIRLYNDENLRRKLSNEAKECMSKGPTWTDFTTQIANDLLLLSQTDAG